jgi:hypothetical protein
MIARAILAGVVALAGLVAACSVGADCDPTAGCTRILFVGNSYTYVNDLPSTVATLARSRGHAVSVTMVAQGGETLADHVSSGDVARAIGASRWSAIVLQEQSEVPAAPDLRASGMVPAAAQLAGLARAAGARLLFFETWAHRDGWPERGLPSARRMQSALDDGYDAAARATNAAAVPVGDAWMAAVDADPEINLWQDDGSHPTAAGTYLAAVALDASIFGDDPVGLPAADGVSADQAAALRQVVARVLAGAG